MPKHHLVLHMITTEVGNIYESLELLESSVWPGPMNGFKIEASVQTFDEAVEWPASRNFNTSGPRAKRSPRQ
jgi:hypothetical protein